MGGRATRVDQVLARVEHEQPRLVPDPDGERLEGIDVGGHPDRASDLERHDALVAQVRQLDEPHRAGAGLGVATARARRVFPAPPGPVSVTMRLSSSAA